MSDLTIRPATADDLPAINDIYNHYVLHSTSTYQEEPEPMDGRRAWFARHGAAYPVIVAVLDGTVVGWGSLSPFHVRSAYRRTVENSVYVRHDLHRRGIGGALLNDLIARARSIGHHSIIGLIDAEPGAQHRAAPQGGFHPGSSPAAGGVQVRPVAGRGLPAAHAMKAPLRTPYV